MRACCFNSPASLRRQQTTCGRTGRFAPTQRTRYYDGALPLLLSSVAAAWTSGSPLPPSLQGKSVLVTTREPALVDGAFPLELNEAVPHAVSLAEGVYAAVGEPGSLARLLSLRCELQPLAAASSPTALLAAVAQLSWSNERRLDGLDWELAHERRGELSDNSHLPSPELCARLSEACGRSGASRMRVPRGACPPTSLRFACVETPHLCIFGIVAFAGGSAADADDAWATRPHGCM